MIKYFSLLIFTFLTLEISSFTNAQVVGGGGSGGGLRRSTTFASVFFPRQSNECNEGDSRILDDLDSASGKRISVRKLCMDGRFYQKANIEYDKLRCKEGSYSTAHSKSTGEVVTKIYLCQDGKRKLVRVR